MSIEDDGALEGAPEEEAYAPAAGIFGEDEEEFSPFDELGDEYAGEPIQKVLGEDGLPTIAAPGPTRDIPPLSPETLICMGDYSEFRSAEGEVFSFAEVEREPYAGPDDSGHHPSGWRWVKRGTHLRVEPKRRPCKHYIRQLTQLERNPEHRQLIRLCSGRRTTEGAMMSVGERGLWECDMRVPLAVVGLMDQMDEEKMRAGRDEPVNMFSFQEENKDE